MPGQGIAPYNITYSPQELMNVLYVEDQNDYLELIGGHLSDWGCNVDKVKYPKDALEYLYEKNYRLVIFDHEFGAEHMKGLAFLTQYRDMLRHAKPVLLTQYAGAVRDMPAHHREWIKVIDKPNYEEDLAAEVKSVYREVCADLSKNKTSLIEPNISKYPIAEEQLNLFQEELILGLQLSENVERKSLMLGNAMYSVSDLIEQVRQGTTLGRELVAVFYRAKTIERKTRAKYASTNNATLDKKD